ncbi:MAG: RrF2 family transcriptional regulator [Planctomycetota bacterium]|jgi:Rrf2 family protein
MKVSRSTGYALLAVAYIAQHKDEKIILSQSIAKKHNIPVEYLLKILQQMVRANILTSKRGPRGGFSLAIPTKKISMLQIIEAVEGPYSSQLNLAEHSPGQKFCNKAEQAYKKGLDEAKNVFGKIKLSSLIE